MVSVLFSIFSPPYFIKFRELCRLQDAGPQFPLLYMYSNIKSKLYARMRDIGKRTLL